MQHYYFIQENEKKEGPLTLQELKNKIIYSEDLIWRSDSDQWRKANEFKELNDILIIKPPPTPKEISLKKFNQIFFKETLIIILITYLFASFLTGIFSTNIATTSWKKFLKENGNKPDAIAYSNSRYPRYLLDFNNEALYGDAQGFYFRSTKAFTGTIYLTKEEQEKKGILFKNLLLSSFVSFLFIFFPFSLIYYLIKRASVT